MERDEVEFVAAEQKMIKDRTRRREPNDEHQHLSGRECLKEQKLKHRV